MVSEARCSPPTQRATGECTGPCPCPLLKRDPRTPQSPRELGETGCIRFPPPATHRAGLPLTTSAFRGGVLRIQISTDTVECPLNVSMSNKELHFPVINHMLSPLE